MTKEQKYLLWICRAARRVESYTNDYAYYHAARKYSLTMFGRVPKEWIP